MPECPWCEFIRTNCFWRIPPTSKNLCTGHAELWPSAAEACLLAMTNCITRAKVNDWLLAIRKKAAAVCGKELARGPKGWILKDIAPAPEAQS